MKTSTAIIAAALIAAAAVGAYLYKRLGSTPHRRGAIRVGDELDHDFDRPMYNGRGIGSLQHLRGQPTLILIWGKN